MTARCGRAAALCVAALVGLTAQSRAQSSTYEQLQTFSSLLNQVRVNYADSVTTERLVRGAISGMLQALDPHSYFMAHEDAEKMIAYRGGRLASSGIVVDDAEEQVVVQSVVRRSPAERAGVQPGDRVLAIDEKPMAGLRAPSVQVRLVGDPGQRVRVLLERGPRIEPETVSVHLRFDRVEPRSVALARTLDSAVGYVRLAEFNDNAARELRDAVGRVARGEPRRLILDLRGNPGGIVDQARDIAGLFLRRDQQIFRTHARHRDNDSTYTARRDGEFADVRLVVLIDERSASASEAVAGTLQDHDRALLIGRRSFGKALMQRAFDVPPAGDIVMLTIGWVVLPSGRLIQRPYRGMTSAQYRALAGQAPDSGVAVFKSDGGRIVTSGGGLMPDSLVAPPAALPAWFTAAADSGLHLAVADSVATTLVADERTRAQWFDAAEIWRTRLVEPFLARARARLGVAARPDSALAERLGRILADRVIEVRWGADAEEDFRLRHDPAIRTALSAIVRLPVLLAQPVTR